MTEDEITEMEELEDALSDTGFDEDEISELLYDPAPRRRKSSKAKASSGKPRRKYKKSGRPKKSARGALAKFSKYVLPGLVAGSFYLSYAANAKARGLTLMDALKADLSSWSFEKTIAKIQASPMPAIGAIGIPIVKDMKVLPSRGYGSIVVDAIQGIMTGQFLTQIVDEPAPPVRTTSRSSETITVQRVMAPQEMMRKENPYTSVNYS